MIKLRIDSIICNVIKCIDNNKTDNNKNDDSSNDDSSNDNMVNNIRNANIIQ